MAQMQLMFNTTTGWASLVEGTKFAKYFPKVDERRFELCR